MMVTDRDSDQLLKIHRTPDDCYYTERDLWRKHHHHECRYSEPPDRLTLAFTELDGMAILDLLHFGELAGLDSKQSQVWELTVYGVNMAEIGRQTGVTGEAIGQMLARLRKRIAAVASANPHYGWMAAYLETVLMRHLF